MAWDHASHEEKLEIKNEYDVSIVGRVINIYSILTVTLFFGIFHPINSVAVNNFLLNNFQQILWNRNFSSQKSLFDDLKNL